MSLRRPKPPIKGGSAPEEEEKEEEEEGLALKYPEPFVSGYFKAKPFPI